MKKIAGLLVLLVSTSIISGCGNKLASNRTNSSPVKVEKNTEKQKEELDEEISDNIVEFSEVKENELPSNMAYSIKLLKPNKGYFYELVNHTYYIAIFSGKKPTGGYRIKVKSVETVEGKTIINVDENAPKQNDIVTQAITYPYTIIKASNVTDDFIVKNTNGEIFEKMKKEWQEY